MLKTLSALCAVVGLCTMLAAPGARATPATEIFIQLNVDKGYMILNSTSLSDAERREQFRTLLLGLAASRRIALFTLGPFATGAAPADVDAFVEAFTNYSVAVYENRLDRYKGETLKVTGSSDRAADDSVVQTELVSPNPSNGPPIRIAFRVRRGENGAPAVTDMQIEGVSLAMTQRDDFTAYLQQHNGSIPELAKHLGALSDKIALKAEKVSADLAAEHGAGK
jgi:phospholipid transport system substrate-binding protein